MDAPIRKPLKFEDSPVIKVKTPMPDSVMGALVDVMQEMYSMDFSKPGKSVTTRLIIEGSSHTVELKGLIRQVDADQQYERKPNFGMSEFARNSGISSYGYNQMRCTTDVSIELMLDHAEIWELPEVVPEPKIKTKQEEQIMFSKHVISEVVVGEINPITLELAVKKLTIGNANLQLVTKKDVTYLIVEDSDPIELNSERFKALVETALIGKTIAEVKANANLASLITNLNVLDSITLTKREANLADILK